MDGCLASFFSYSFPSLLSSCRPLIFFLPWPGAASYQSTLVKSNANNTHAIFPPPKIYSTLFHASSTRFSPATITPLLSPFLKLNSSHKVLLKIIILERFYPPHSLPSDLIMRDIEILPRAVFHALPDLDSRKTHDSDGVVLAVPKREGRREGASVLTPFDQPPPRYQHPCTFPSC